MATVTYQYIPDQQVRVITDCGIKSGTIVNVNIDVLASGTNILYDIRLDGELGTTQFEEADVFADLTSALTEYETRIQ